MTDLMPETRASLLARVWPDLASISRCVEEAGSKTASDELARYLLKRAIDRTVKLLEDLSRAAKL